MEEEQLVPYSIVLWALWSTCIPLLISIRLDDEVRKATANSANKYAAVTIKSSSLWFYQISLGKAFPYDDSWLCGFYDG